MCPEWVVALSLLDTTVVVQLQVYGLCKNRNNNKALLAIFNIQVHFMSSRNVFWHLSHVAIYNNIKMYIYILKKIKK